MTEAPRIFAISDLHLPGGVDKAMDLFGEHWQDHFSKIREDWLGKVTKQDIVLIPGDISWAMRLEDALIDLHAIGELPGQKIIIKGNHDFWWSSLTRVRDALPKSIHALQNDAILLGDAVFCGSRGWSLPGNEDDSQEDRKLFSRELIRLRLSLKAAQQIRYTRRLVALCHFPPLNGRGEDSEVSSLLEEFRVDDVVYGHLHGPACAAGFSGLKNGIRYWFTSCDCLGFKLLEVS